MRSKVWLLALTLPACLPLLARAQLSGFGEELHKTVVGGQAYKALETGFGVPGAGESGRAMAAMSSKAPRFSASAAAPKSKGAAPPSPPSKEKGPGGAPGGGKAPGKGGGAPPGGCPVLEPICKLVTGLLNCVRGVLCGLCCGLSKLFGRA